MAHVLHIDGDTHGHHVAVHPTPEAAKADLVRWCQWVWHEDGMDYEMPGNDDELISQVFEGDYAYVRNACELDKPFVPEQEEDRWVTPIAHRHRRPRRLRLRHHLALQNTVDASSGSAAA